jgi:hypothetical protein
MFEYYGDTFRLTLKKGAGSMKKVLCVALLAVFFTSVQQISAYEADGQIGSATHYYYSGKLYYSNFAIYDYVGGTQTGYAVAYTYNNNADVVDFSNKMWTSFLEWTKIRYINYSRSDGSFYTGNNVQFDVYHY